MLRIPKPPVNIKSVNHGKVFSEENWFTFYCGNCDRQVHKGDKHCNFCGAILQPKGAKIVVDTIF